MELTDAFHKMEIDEKLFDIGKNICFPYWDIVRYGVYVKYYYPEESRKKLSIIPNKSYSEYISLLKNLLIFIGKVIFSNGENIICTSSRYRDSLGVYYDKNALPFIEIMSNNCIVSEAVLIKKIKYKHIYDFKFIFRKVYYSDNFPLEYYYKLNESIVKHLKKNIISYNEINKIYHDFKSDYIYYYWLFKLKKTKKLFVATGNNKAVFYAAKKCKIQTYLLQHSAIEFDHIENSYPHEVSINSNIFFADTLLTYGEYWGKGINIPVKKIIPIGYDMAYLKCKVESDDSVLIVSTSVHGIELKYLTKKLAVSMPEVKFVYKLHTNENKLYQEYVDFFCGNDNVKVLSGEVDISYLIALSQLVIVIVSSVLYEALAQNKKVAVYKKIDYKTLTHLFNQKNVFFFDSDYEVRDILKKTVEKAEVDFYKPINNDLIRRICNNNFI